MTIKIACYEQEVHGREHWRVMRDDGRLIFGRHHTDFDSEADALSCIDGELRREKLGPGEVRVEYLDRQANGRRPLRRVITVNDSQEA